jgi:hypothetical protein
MDLLGKSCATELVVSASAASTGAISRLSIITLRGYGNEVLHMPQCEGRAYLHESVRRAGSLTPTLHAMRAVRDT